MTAFQLVYGDHEVALPLIFDPLVEDRLVSRMRQLQEHGLDKSEIAKRVVDAISSIFDGAVIPPSERQSKYALAICRELNLELPADCIQSHDAMRAFISAHAQDYQRRKGYRTGKPQ